MYFVKDGHSPKDAAKKFRVSLGATYRACAEFGVPVGVLRQIRPGKIPLLEVLAHLVRGVDSKTAIAERFQCTRQYVSMIAQRAKAAGLCDGKVNPQVAEVTAERQRLKSEQATARIRETRRIATRKQKERRDSPIVRDLHQGLTVDETAKKHRRSIPRIYQIAKEYGVAPRDAIIHERKRLGIIRDLLLGKSPREIATAHGTTASAVNSVRHMAKQVGLFRAARRFREGA